MYMNRNHWIEDVPVIMISSEESENYIRKAFKFGVSDYISRPFDSKVVYQRVFNTIKLYAKQRRLISMVSDQMHEKEKNNQIAVIRRQIICIRILNKSFQKKSRQCIDVDNMKAALSITKFHNLA